MRKVSLILSCVASVAAKRIGTQPEGLGERGAGNGTGKGGGGSG